MNDRISALIEALGMNQSGFAKALGTSSSRISNITTGRNKPDSDILTSIVENFRNVNSSWLLTGEGQMFLDDDNLIDNPNDNLIQEKTGVREKDAHLNAHLNAHPIPEKTAIIEDSPPPKYHKSRTKHETTEQTIDTPMTWREEREYFEKVIQSLKKSLGAKDDEIAALWEMVNAYKRGDKMRERALRAKPKD